MTAVFVLRKPVRDLEYGFNDAQKSVQIPTDLRSKCVRATAMATSVVAVTAFREMLRFWGTIRTRSKNQNKKLHLQSHDLLKICEVARVAANPSEIPHCGGVCGLTLCRSRP